MGSGRTFVIRPAGREPGRIREASTDPAASRGREPVRMPPKSGVGFRSQCGRNFKSEDRFGYDGRESDELLLGGPECKTPFITDSLEGNLGCMK